MRLPANRTELVTFWCWLYIGIGLCSLGAGLFVLYIMHQLGRQSPEGLGFIAFILILFGPLRILNSGWVLNRIRKQPR